MILHLEAVTYTYPDANDPALHALDLELTAGEFVVLAGASGSGKSTLLRIASGLVPHFHGGTFAGTATVAGMDIRTHGPAQLAGAVGTLFQDPETQVVLGTVRAELGFGLENRGTSPGARARAVEEVALALGIAHLLERSTAELSGGELQRVALGAALAGRPALVVLDEPTSQLDPVAGEELISVLRRINEDSDTTILLAEHRLERCLPAADRVLAMDGGRIVCDASPRDFLTWAARAAPTLRTPAASLLGALGLPPATRVKTARAALRDAGYAIDGARAPEPTPADSRRARPARRRGTPVPALALQRAWVELHGGGTILRDVSLEVRRGERVALMGRNGAGKSTLLRVAAGLTEPTRGGVAATGRVALLLQNPMDYLVHDRVADEAPPDALARVGLGDPSFADRHPRELSGGERQRLALAIVLGGEGDPPPTAVLLDEPTRGMDRGHKADLAALLAQLPMGIIVATHDPEFAAAFAERVVLLADGAPIADGPVGELLTGGGYFVTETARILGGLALTPQEGAELLRASQPGGVSCGDPARKPGRMSVERAAR